MLRRQVAILACSGGRSLELFKQQAGLAAGHDLAVCAWRTAGSAWPLHWAGSRNRLLQRQGLEVCTEQATGCAVNASQKLLVVLCIWQHLRDRV